MGAEDHPERARRSRTGRRRRDMSAADTRRSLGSWIVLFSPLAAFLVSARLDASSLEADTMAYLAVVVLIFIGTHAAMHTLESAALDIVGVAFIVICGCLPWWLPFYQQHSAMVQAWAAQLVARR